MKKKIVLVVGMSLCLTMVGCSSNSKDTDNTSKNETNVEESADKAEGEAEKEEESKKEEENKSEEQIYNMGDNIEFKDWGIVVTNMQIVESIAADYGVFEPNEEGNKYAQVFVTVTNNGKEADSFLPIVGYGDDINAKMIYGDGYEFSATNLLGYNADLHSTSINPLSSKEGEIAFEIPESVANASDEMFIQFKSGNDTVKVKIR